jgi:uncharacterized protein (DUF1800 family)
MMELFSLGADRGAYTEDDIREQARTLTGWRNDWSSEQGAHNFRFEPKWHDTGNKTVFGKTGNWGWEDACHLCVEHPLLASRTRRKRDARDAVRGIAASPPQCPRGGH